MACPPPADVRVLVIGDADIRPLQGKSCRGPPAHRRDRTGFVQQLARPVRGHRGRAVHSAPRRGIRREGAAHRREPAACFILSPDRALDRRSATATAASRTLIEGVRMRLTAFTDYTLRALIYLALRPDRLVTIADIATAYDISANHLMKVVHQLAQTGDIETVRGQRGGVRLARPPEAINLGSVVRRTEPDLELVACFGEAQRCVIQEGCVLQH